MATKELLKQALDNCHLPIVQETEQGMVIRYQLDYVLVDSPQDNFNAVAVTLAGTFSSENDREARIALKACNEVNHRMMQVKLYLDTHNDLVISSEFFYMDEQDIEFLLKYALRSLTAGKKKFISQYQALDDEDKLIEELNDD